jgi:DNA-binding response OmpR family regulator
VTRYTVLIVDDDVNLATTLSVFLESEGYSVETAENGRVALDKLSSISPDLILLDMNMPEMGGVGFIKHISLPDGKLQYPVIVFTTRANMAEFFDDVDVVSFMPKPCDPDELLEEIRKVCVKTATPQDAPRKVLLGEDDGGTLETLNRAFTKAGLTVIEVLNGSELLQKAIVEKPDIIVVKLVLTGMNGDTAAKMLSEMPDTRDVPIILYDDSGTGVSAAKFLDSGAAVKRFVRTSSAAELLAAIGDIHT